MSKEIPDSSGVNCPDCGVEVGEYHEPGCDWEDCPYCGLQLLGCEHSGAVPRDDRIPFAGTRAIEKTAVELGWYAVPVPGKGWTPCDKNTPGSIPDLNRVPVSCTWDRMRKKFIPREDGADGPTPPGRRPDVVEEQDSGTESK